MIQGQDEGRSKEIRFEGRDEGVKGNVSLRTGEEVEGSHHKCIKGD